MYEDEDFEESESPKKLNTLKRRRDFVYIAQKGNRIATKGMVVEFAKITGGADEDHLVSDDEQVEEAREQRRISAKEIASYNYSPEIGFTASKKVGSAVYRNKAKRRLKEAAREILKHNPKLFKKNYKFNIIARHSAIDRSFESLVRDLKYALHNVK